MEYEPILPLRAVAFQIVFLMVAIAIEAGILRQRLRLGFQTSVQYAILINLASVVVGWMAFLIIEPLSPPPLKAQIISYVLYDRLLLNGWTAQVGGAIFAVGLVAFFVTFFIKAKGLELIMRSDSAWGLPKTSKPFDQLPRDQRYARAREGRTEARQAISDFTDTVILANAASFSAILLLLLLRAVAEGWI